ncbi:MAG: Rne/Rng family ribonuclease [Firmicutes bacterium]|jgi:ribonuclease G|nr:Rne/Rng family ribonuclease [Bacillota bacterium]
MSKEIIVSTGPGETRAAVIENGRLVEVYIERTAHQRHVGNIYKGRVENVLPGMQAAFVNIGLERNAFLYVDDALKAREGHFDDVDIEDLKALSIRDILKENQDIIVQATKEPIGTKGARVVTQVTLPGRNVVLMPTVDYVGVSRRITDDEERTRLKKAAGKAKPRGYGVIVRTAAEGKDESEISSEIKFLTKLWRRVKQKARRSSAPSLLHRDYDLIYRIMRDLLSDDVDAFIIDDEHEFGKAEDIIKIMSPRLRSRLELYDGETPILEAYEIEDEIEKALRSKVWLSCGGYIVFDETEALTSIDVNTGRYTGTVNLQDTVLKTNLEAASAIAHHLRLRNIGGIIVIDFIDMDSEDAREQVAKQLEEELKKDKTKATVLGFTHLGLLEMTRKKTRPGLQEALTRSCPYCDGRGLILSEETLAFRAERVLKQIAGKTDQEAMLVTLHPNVASLLIGQGGGNLSRLEQETGKIIYVRGNPNVHMEDMGEIVTGKQEAIRKMAVPVSVGDVIEVEIKEQHASNPANGITRIDGYILDIDGAGGIVGKRILVEIRKVFRTYAKGKPVETKEDENVTPAVDSKSPTNMVIAGDGHV